MFEALVGSAAPFNLTELATVTLAQVKLVTVGDLILQTNPYAIIVPDAVQITSTAEVALQVDPSLYRAQTIVPARLAGFEVDDWFPVTGQPVTQSGLTVVVEAQAGVGTPRELETFPRPQDVQINAWARWLPTDGTLTPDRTTWYPYSEYVPGPAGGYTVADIKTLRINELYLYKLSDLLGSGTLVVAPRTDVALASTPGAAPVLREKYTYVRSSGTVRNKAMAFTGGQYFVCDDLTWGAEQVTVLAVMVPHDPIGDWYGVLETASPSVELVPYFGVRYSRTGAVALFSDTVLASQQLLAGAARPNQPVVVGFSLDLVSQKVTLFSVDDQVRTTTGYLTERIPPDSRLYIGRSPLGDTASAVMDVLEVAVFTTQFTENTLNRLLADYDRMYGVTTS